MSTKYRVHRFDLRMTADQEISKQTRKRDHRDHSKCDGPHLLDSSRGFCAHRGKSGLNRNVVLKKQMTCKCRAHAVVILSPIPIMGVDSRKE